jgi:peptidoglycan/xylan/chitin deacetylase (PgdA/CDA1 family)
VTVPEARIEALLAAADERGLPFYTYKDIAAGDVDGPGLAYSFDDAHVDEWYALRPLFDRYDVRATFFVTRFPTMNEDRRAKLHQLEDEGHDIEFHGANHQNSQLYVEEHGLEDYLINEIDAGVQAMRDDGFDPTVFAYPFGVRTKETDEALLERFELVRAIRGTCPRGSGHAEE